ncbi:TRAP transporter large permease [Geosporobacter ferrireducens]|uniref:TRAP transporter large permease n=1 Tax=Geosporobacter ferrireducens TaxID=1424294 RepID=UPI00139DACED|nr:TRAP transporter large permease [Geosporobacter ferrireducens]MTI58077.1 TRAP transporter large permease [Geosporobacter ferrireducens]
MITDPTAVAILLGVMFGLIFFGTPIAIAIGVASVITTTYIGIPLMTVAQNLVKGINVYALMAVPFFILAGEIMGTGGISRRLIELSNALVGWLRGGLAMVNIVASMFFGGISGSSAADTSSIGSVMIPMMKDAGYDGEFSTAVTMTSSVQGILIPPSHNMVLYAMVVGGVSIGELFMGGLVPGVLLGVALMIYCYIISTIRNYPIGEKFNLRAALKTTLSASLGLGTVFIVVGGVISGIFTATESAAIAVVYSFIVTFFIYREVPLSEFSGMLGRSIKTLSIVMILVGCASAFGWLIAYLKIPAFITSKILAISSNKYVLMLIINVLLLFLGMIMDMASIILIVTPILYPIAMQIGLDPVHFGVMMILNLGVGLITPPVGSTLFIGSAIAGIKIEKLAKAMIPFYVVMVIVLLIITYIPEVVLFVPKLMRN